MSRAPSERETFAGLGEASAMRKAEPHFAPPTARRGIPIHIACRCTATAQQQSATVIVITVAGALNLPRGENVQRSVLWFSNHRPNPHVAISPPASPPANGGIRLRGVDALLRVSSVVRRETVVKSTTWTILSCTLLHVLAR
jgi:hypothetical protein